MSLRVSASFIVGLALLGVAGSAQANSPFDGAWSVLIITESGTCDRAYRYSVNVADGVLRYAGDAAIKLDGRVSEGGQVRVTIGRGDQSATGKGRLSQTAGSGTWSGKSAQNQCRGTWQAEKR